MNETVFHLIFTVSFVIFTLIRVAFRRMAQKTEGEVEYKEGPVHRGIRLAIGLPFILLLFIYMVYPPVLSWAAFRLPEWVRWLGAALMVGSLPLILWVQWALGSNFDTTLHVRAEHTLVSHGPYRWVRHPMYTALYLLMVGMLLLTANWAVGVLPLLSLTLIVLTRTAHEEAVLTEKFGDAYRAYMQRTGRFLPKLR